MYPLADLGHARNVADGIVGVGPDIPFRDGRKRDFHDRVVTVRSLDEGEMINLRWDVTAGIDNLMSRSKECSVFVEER